MNTLQHLDRREKFAAITFGVSALLAVWAVGYTAAVLGGPVAAGFGAIVGAILADQWAKTFHEKWGAPI